MKKNKRDEIIAWVIGIMILVIVIAFCLGAGILKARLQKWIWTADISTVYAAETVSKESNGVFQTSPKTGESHRIVNPFGMIGILDKIEYAKHVGKVPETDPEDSDLDFWLKVTAPPTEEELEEEDRLGDMELLAQLIQAEAGDQDLTGMRLVADVVLNRVDSSKYPDSIRDVIFQNGQFTVVRNGMLSDAAWNMSEKAFRAAELEMNSGRLDSGILYFSTYPANGRGFWKHGAHYFSY